MVMADNPIDSDNYQRGFEDFRKERIGRGDMRSPVGVKRDSQERRFRSRSPIRSRSPSRDRGRRGSMANRPRRGDRAVSAKECRVYVRNLPYDTRWMDLKDVMKRVGEVEHAEVFMEPDGRSKGCGVVEFKHKEDAAKAIKDLDGYEVKGRALRLREDKMDDGTYQQQLKNLKEKSLSFKQQGQGDVKMNAMMQQVSAATSQQQMLAMLNNKNVDPINCSVFVSNLDYEVNWKQLKDTFKRAGNCLRAEIQEDKAERKSKGFGSVVFETPLEALCAVATFNGMEIKGRTIQVRLDRNAKMTEILNSLGIQSNNITQAQLIQLQSMATLAMLSSGGMGNFGFGGGLGGIGGAYGGLQSGQGQASSGLGGMGMGGLMGGGPNSSGLGNNSMNSSSYSSAGLGGSSLTSRSGLGSQSSSQGGGYGGYSGLLSLSNNYGTSPSRSNDNRGRGSEQERSVFVRNLPFSTTWQELKDKFRDVGKVLRADIMQDENRRSKGCGIVVFEIPDDAHRAVQYMNGCRMEGREIEVRLDRK